MRFNLLSVISILLLLISFLNSEAKSKPVLYGKVSIGNRIIKNAEIKFISTDQTYSIKTDQRGNYAINDKLNPGKYDISVNGWEVTPLSVEIIGAQSHNHNIQCYAKTRKVFGKIINSKNNSIACFENTEIMFVDAKTGKKFKTKIDWDGYYMFGTELIEGNYNVWIKSSRYEPFYEHNVKVGPNNNFRYDFTLIPKEMSIKIDNIYISGKKINPTLFESVTVTVCSKSGIWLYNVKPDNCGYLILSPISEHDLIFLDNYDENNNHYKISFLK